MPSYKAQKFIKRTIKSVLEQKDVKVEIIVVEDGVYDNTQEVLNEFEERVKLVTFEKNMGAQKARNKGLELASSEYVMFLDADDFFEGDDFLKGLYDSIVKNKSDVVFGRGIKRWQDGEEKKFYVPKDSETQEEIIIRWLIGRAGPSPCSILWRKSSLIKIGGWNEIYTKNQDGELVIRAMLQGLKPSYSQKGAGVYWQYDGDRISKKISNERFECQERLYYDIKKSKISKKASIESALNYYIAGVAAQAILYKNDQYTKKFSELWKRDMPKIDLISQHSFRMYLTHVLYFLFGIKCVRFFIDKAKKILR